MTNNGFRDFLEPPQLVCTPSAEAGNHCRLVTLKMVPLKAAFWASSAGMCSPTRAKTSAMQFASTTRPWATWCRSSAPSGGQGADLWDCGAACRLQVFALRSCGLKLLTPVIGDSRSCPFDANVRLCIKEPAIVPPSHSGDIGPALTLPSFPRNKQ